VFSTGCVSDVYEVTEEPRPREERLEGLIRVIRPVPGIPGKKQAGIRKREAPAGIAQEGEAKPNGTPFAHGKFIKISSILPFFT
jgi:hypothetical protein